MTFNWADWAIVAIVLFSALFGLKRGLIKEALSLANWIIAVLVAVSFRGALSVILENRIPTPSIRELFSFGLLFVCSLLVGSLVNHLVGELVKVTGLGSTDRSLGALFGIVRGFVIVMAILILIPPIISINKDLWWSQSALISVFLAFEEGARMAASEIASWFARFFVLARGV